MASIDDNVANSDIYGIEQNTQDINRVLSSRMDQAYPSYMNVQSVSQIPQQPPNYPVNTGFTNNQNFQSIYPRLQVQNDTTEDEPIYVNAKQYNRIILRRKARAKWEAEHRVTKKSKPYMHESRHEHALRRIRGPDGRFLKKDEIEAMIKRGELKLNTPPPQSMDRPSLPMQFAPMHVPVVDPRMQGIIGIPIAVDQNQQDMAGVADKNYQFCPTDAAL